MGKMKLKVAAGLVCITAGVLFFAGFSQEGNKGESAIDADKSPAITAIPVQLGRESYGLAMMDTETQTLWIYEFNTRGQTFGQLRLIAARSFEHDRKLTEWNTASPTPTEVKKILEAIQAQKQVKEQKQEKKIEELQQVLEQD